MITIDTPKHIAGSAYRLRYTNQLLTPLGDATLNILTARMTEQ